MLLLILMDPGNTAKLVASLVEIPPHTWTSAGCLGLGRNLAE